MEKKLEIYVEGYMTHDGSDVTTGRRSSVVTELLATANLPTSGLHIFWGPVLRVPMHDRTQEVFFRYVWRGHTTLPKETIKTYEQALNRVGVVLRASIRPEGGSHTEWHTVRSSWQDPPRWQYHIMLAVSTQHNSMDLGRDVERGLNVPEDRINEVGPIEASIEAAEKLAEEE